MSGYKKSVQNPITTTNSIIAAKYKDGILLASDRAVSYGSCFKFANVSHFAKLTPNIIIGGTGELADFQELVDVLRSIIVDEECKNNGESLTPSEVSNYIKRLMYERRSKMNPFVMRCILAGIDKDGSKLLTATDLYGTQWEDEYVASGYGAHMQGVQIPKALKSADVTRDVVMDAIKEVFIGLTARHSTMSGPIEFVDVTANGIEFLDPIEIVPNWDVLDEDWAQ
uniref:Proteasome subunit beta n=1 Tax=Tritrichomonas foetus TaxID=1144522 RepID=A0A075KJR6_9EUKA|nr:20S proteasome subunit beta 7 [Tritrichomonas foetus]